LLILPHKIKIVNTFKLASKTLTAGRISCGKELTMKFISKEHEEFYKKQLEKSKSKDCYHRTLFYILGIDDDTRKHFIDLYNCEKDIIKLSGIHSGWITSTSRRMIRFAFNMFNGYYENEESLKYTPYDLFLYIPNKYIEYMFYGIMLSKY
jgi:hypothetical protein